MMGSKVLGFLCLLVLCSSSVFSDSITIDGKQYSNVLIYETDIGYVVRLPSDGSTLNVRKENARAVNITEDYGERDALLIQYEEARKKKNEKPINLEPVMEELEEPAESPVPVERVEITKP